MKIAIFNGSPRKRGNTATLLRECLAGAEEAGADCEFVHLYSLDYKGCISCLECKRAHGRHAGTCVMRDGLTPILETLEDHDGLIVGSPIYLGSETGETRSFLERIVYPYLTYTPGYKSVFPKTIPTGLVYTMNVDGERKESEGYHHFMDRTQGYLERFFGPCERLECTGTPLFEDFSKYRASAWDPEEVARRKAETFPAYLRRARELGARLVERAKAE